MISTTLRFPEEISYGSSGGPEYSTELVSMTNGTEQRNINWPIGRNRFNISQCLNSEQDVERLLEFFRACKGKARAFRFKDWNDYKAQGQVMKPIKSNVFQLVKRYNMLPSTLLAISSSNTMDHYYEERIIYKPTSGTVNIYSGKQRYYETSDYKIDYETGQITFLALSFAAPLMADFEFDIPVRFDTDYLRISADNYGINNCHDIPLIEIIPYTAP
jgi:uncharacterized protein (TIGR02217 family)